MDELIVPEMADDLEKAISESTDDFVRLPKRLAENLAKTINHNEPKKRMRMYVRMWILSAQYTTYAKRGLRQCHF
jgi:hypothetical protein